MVKQSGLFGLSSPLISVDTSPTWSTAAGNIASVIEPFIGVNVTPTLQMQMVIQSRILKQPVI